jgi:hypothetical protein
MTIRDILVRLVALTLVIQGEAALGDIIVVDTSSGASPPKVAAISEPRAGGTGGLEGYPRDFIFFVSKTYPDRDPRRSLERGLAKINAKRVDRDAKNKTVLHSTRFDDNGAVMLETPSLYALPDRLDPEERVPAEWGQIILSRRRLVDTVIRSVCRIEYTPVIPTPEASVIAGTGFVVGPNVVMTNRHVIEEFAEFNETTKAWEFRKLKFNDKVSCEVSVNFAGVYGKLPQYFAVKQIAYATPPTAERQPLDVAVLEIQVDQGRTLPPPLALRDTKPERRELIEQRNVVVCGYLGIGRYSREEVDVRFLERFLMFNVKRVSLGNLVYRVDDDRESNRLYHNCTTSLGNSGSPVVDLGTGTVWGLHFGGPPDAFNNPKNSSEPMWRLLEVPQIRKRVQVVPPIALNEDTDAQPKSTVAELQKSRPVRFVRATPDLDQSQVFDVPDYLQPWFASASSRPEVITRALAAVGQFQVHEAANPLSPYLSVTCFLIAPGVVVVPMEPDAYVPLGNSGEILQGVQAVTIDFQRCVEQKGRPVIQVLRHIYTSRVSGVSFYAIPPGSEGPARPLVIEDERLGQPGALVSGEVAVVGHPSEDPDQPREIFYRVFPPPFFVKRVAFGKVLDPGHIWSGQIPEPMPGKRYLFHDCSTSIGDMGAPVLNLKTGRLVGIHVAGLRFKANGAIPIWSILDDPELARIPELKAMIEAHQQNGERAGRKR